MTRIIKSNLHPNTITIKFFWAFPPKRRSGYPLQSLTKASEDFSYYP
ncbi:MAG: hypothetical protein HY841_08130 [Bacteroidetes bacterium]|nr:hypothetical protein [Bacteroidota bacterium]